MTIIACCCDDGGDAFHECCCTLGPNVFNPMHVLVQKNGSTLFADKQLVVQTQVLTACGGGNGFDWKSPAGGDPDGFFGQYICIIGGAIPAPPVTVETFEFGYTGGPPLGLVVDMTILTCHPFHAIGSVVSGLDTYSIEITQ